MISVVIPIMNEPGVFQVIKEVNEALLNQSHEIIIIDKSDKIEPHKFDQPNVKYYRQKSIGYGNAYIEGFNRSKGNFLVMIDGDASYSGFDIPKMMELIQENHVDFVIGNRWYDLKPGSMHPLHYLGNKIITFLTQTLFNSKIKDSQCGLRVLTKFFFESSTFIANDMSFATEMVIKAEKMKISYKQHPISYFPRQGQSKLSPVNDGMRILKRIILNIG